MTSVFAASVIDHRHSNSGPPFSSFGPSRDYGIGLSIRNGLAVRNEEQAKKVSKIFPTNEIARNKICSADLLNGHEWRKVGCVVENKLEFRQ
jgi:hypothetical protein